MVELDEDELAEYAELWGVDVEQVEDLFEAISQDDIDFSEMSLVDVQEYIQDLHDTLEEQGFDVDISDLWDMYYGYTPGGES
jgi:hypothetical protein